MAAAWWISRGGWKRSCTKTRCSPDVRADLETFFARIAPEGRGLYVHDAEGPDDMPAHIRAALTQTQLGIPIIGGRLMLGTWQAIYLYEHRTRPHRRELALHLLGGDEVTDEHP